MILTVATGDRPDHQTDTRQPAETWDDDKTRSGDRGTVKEGRSALDTRSEKDRPAGGRQSQLDRRSRRRNLLSPLTSPNRNRSLPSTRRRRSRLHDFAPSRSISTTDSRMGRPFVAFWTPEAGTASIRRRR